MADVVWYFAVNDEERGPVTEAQLRALIGTGNLSRNDLVWKEGMEDWVPAGEIPGWFDKDGGARPSDAAPATAERRPAQPAAPAAKLGAPSTAFAMPPARVEPGEQPSFAFSKPLNLLQHISFLGQPLLLIGFLLVLLSRGCDSMATQYATRAKAKAQLAESRFRDDWDTQKTTLEKERQKLLDHKPQTPADQKQAENLKNDLDKLDDVKKAEETELREGKWRLLNMAARDAGPNNQVWGFWRASVFWLGTVAFALGLWIVGFSGTPPERWLSLAMLAIIVYSLYLGLGH